MPNQEQLDILVQGASIWNQWRNTYPDLKPDLSGADLAGINLCGMYLGDVNFIEANLKGANLSRANLRGTYFGYACLDFANLDSANLDNAFLNNAMLRKSSLREATLRRANCSQADFSESNLSHAVLNGAKITQGAIFNRTNLRYASLRQTTFRQTIFEHADLTEVNLTGADLSESDFLNVLFIDANLKRIQALSTNFEFSTFTGACVEDWNINSRTNLSHTVCDYVYLYDKDSGRFPIDRFFEHDEFTRLFQKSANILELIFRGAVDWVAFACSFGKLKIENEDAELAVQSIESKGNGIVVVKVEIAPDFDRTKLHRSFMQGYNLAQKSLDEYYSLRLEDKDKHINQLFSLLLTSQEKLGEVPKLMADHFRNINVSNGNYVESNTGTYVQGDYISLNQDLTQAASQIQSSLDRLQNQGVTIDVAQEQIANSMANQAQNNPTIKAKLIKWGQSLGDAAVSDVIKGVVKLAIRSAGIPLP